MLLRVFIIQLLTWLISVAMSGVIAQDEYYFPGPNGDWETRAPEALGLDGQKLREAINYHLNNERKAPFDERDLALGTQLGLAAGNETFIQLLGPSKRRGDPNGLIIKNGYIVAEWGPTDRVDPTFSLTKTFVSTMVGLAWDRGIISDIHEPVGKLVKNGHFDGEHNGQITWDHLLRQTSEWQGELWGVPAWSDRPGETPWEEMLREPSTPGSRYKYNDVRVNLLALAALEVWRRPLPQVLRELMMDPIGASPTWRWHGYDNSWVLIDGEMMQSVAGGGHFGGGMWISARDIARLGYLALRNGEWDGNRILSEEWIAMARQPGAHNERYGFMNWLLNYNQSYLPSAPRDTFFFAGGGLNVAVVVPEHDLVIVVRWISQDMEDDRFIHLDGFVKRVLAALER